MRLELVYRASLVRFPDHFPNDKHGPEENALRFFCDCRDKVLSTVSAVDKLAEILILV